MHRQNINNMELRTIISFVSVADTGSMTKAAKICHISSSAISKHIKDLEEELDVPLLIRRRYDIKLTEYGEAFLVRAKIMIREARETLDEMASLKGDLRGDLFIGAGSFIEPYIGVALAEFMNKYPKVRVFMQYNTSKELNKQLRSNDLDLAITMNEAYPTEGIDSLPCFKFQLYAIMSKDNDLARKEKVTYNDILQSRIIIPDTGKRALATMQKYTSFDIGKIFESSICVCNNANAILHGLSRLGAISFMPKEYVEYRTNLVAKQIIGFETILTSNAHWMRDVPMKASARAFLDIIKDLAKRNIFSK